MSTLTAIAGVTVILLHYTSITADAETFESFMHNDDASFRSLSLAAPTTGSVRAVLTPKQHSTAGAAMEVICMITQHVCWRHGQLQTVVDCQNYQLLFIIVLSYHGFISAGRFSIPFLMMRFLCQLLPVIKVFASSKLINTGSR